MAGLVLAQLASTSHAEDPPLPAGLGGAPALPAGLGGEPAAVDEISRYGEADLDISGFLELRAGWRIHDQALQKRSSVKESRLQVQAEYSGEAIRAMLTGDLILDANTGHHKLDLESGEGILDLREASLSYSPFDSMDVKLGRQILTWGTGDLLFINDLFPKDYRSFFLGRDVEYLKAPSDALKASLFGGFANMDLVYTPRFDSDRFIDGRRVSYFNTATGMAAGKDRQLQVDQPDGWLSDDEISLRLYATLQGVELSAYAYDGFWKSPAGLAPGSGESIFPQLRVAGFSVRGPTGRGIASLELGYYDSRQDRDGNDPFIRNSEYRLLLGYEQEIARETTLGLQYYLEDMRDYEAYRDSLPAGGIALREKRHVLTARLTRLAMQQKLRLSFFVFYSPSDDDGYARPVASYRWDDQWSLTGGANLFFGDRDTTTFGQFENDSNLYLALRFHY